MSISIELILLFSILGLLFLLFVCVAAFVVSIWKLAKSLAKKSGVLINKQENKILVYRDLLKKNEDLSKLISMNCEKIKSKLSDLEKKDNIAFGSLNATNPFVTNPITGEIL